MPRSTENRSETDLAIDGQPDIVMGNLSDTGQCPLEEIVSAIPSPSAATTGAPDNEAVRIEFLKRIAGLEDGLNSSLEETYGNAIRENDEGLLSKSSRDLIRVFQNASAELKKNLAISGCDPKKEVLTFKKTCDDELSKSDIPLSLKERCSDFLKGIYALFGNAQVTYSRDRHKLALPKMEETIDAIKKVYENLMPQNSKTSEGMSLK